MKKLILAISVLTLAVFFFDSKNETKKTIDYSKFWQVQSIDTMKYSRDASRQNISNQIDNQTRDIAAVGATHVAIDTPYDIEFLPRLKQWVIAARKYNLKVWFRGNFSGWEGWFDYPKNLTREKHIEMTKKFIMENPDLFQNGDIFTPCPECENGGPGDPRQTRDIDGFRKFLIDEYTVTTNSFQSINKNVITNYNSMNGDVAKLIMDTHTTAALGGIVTIDHYVINGTKLANDIANLAKSSQGKIVLGEFGSPIPDINGNLTEEEQASWIKDAMSRLTNSPDLVGINYWVNLGGSTSPWNENGSKRLAINIIQEFYKPNVLNGKIIDTFKHPVKNTTISYLSKSLQTDENGNFQIPYSDENTKITFANDITTKESIVEEVTSNNNTVIFPYNGPNLLKELKRILYGNILHFGNIN